MIDWDKRKRQRDAVRVRRERVEKSNYQEDFDAIEADSIADAEYTRKRTQAFRNQGRTRLEND